MRAKHDAPFNEGLQALFGTGVGHEETGNPLIAAGAHRWIRARSGYSVSAKTPPLDGVKRPDR